MMQFQQKTIHMMHVCSGNNDFHIQIPPYRFVATYELPTNHWECHLEGLYLRTVHCNNEYGYALPHISISCSSRCIVAYVCHKSCLCKYFLFSFYCILAEVIIERHQDFSCPQAIDAYGFVLLCSSKHSLLIIFIVLVPFSTLAFVVKSIRRLG